MSTPTFQSFVDFFAQPHKAQVVLALGKDEALGQLASMESKKKLEDFSNRAYHRISLDEDPAALEGYCAQGGDLFSESQYLEVSYQGSKPSFFLGLFDVLDRFLKSDPSAQTHLFIGAPLMPSPKAKSALLSLPRSVCVDVSPLKERAFGSFFDALLGRSALRMSREASLLLRRLTHGNIVELTSTINHLELLEKEKIEASDVAMICEDSANFAAYSLVQWALAGNAGEALRCLQRLESQDEPLLRVLWFAHRDLSSLLSLMHAPHQNREIWIKKLQIWGEKRQIWLHALSKVRTLHIMKWLHALQELDALIKASNLPLAWQGLYLLLLDIAQRISMHTKASAHH